MNDLLTKKVLLDNIFKTLNEMNIYKSGVISETILINRKTNSTIVIDNRYYLPIKKRPIFFVSLKTSRDLANFLLDFSDLYISNLSKETLMHFSGKKSFYINSVNIVDYEYSYPYLMFLSKFHYSKATLRTIIYFVHFDAENPNVKNFYYFNRWFVKTLKVFTNYRLLKNNVLLLEFELNGRYLI
jgi:hypothetical protein